MCDAGATLRCHMPSSQLEVSRTFLPDPSGQPVVQVEERLRNLAGMQRVAGRSQHVTLGQEMLELGWAALPHSPAGERAHGPTRPPQQGSPFRQTVTEG